MNVTAAESESPRTDQGRVSPSTPPTPDAPIPLLTRARIAFVRAFLVAWARCFSLTGLYRLGQFFGTCEYLCDYNRRRRVNSQLTRFFRDQATPAWRRRMARRYFMRVRCDKMFYTIMDRLPRAKLMNRIKFIGREEFDAALARGRGVYVALCHFGSHHVAGMLMALMGYRLVGVRDPKESAVRRYIQQKYRETFPEVAAMKYFYAGAFPRELYRHLRDNSIVASLIDVDRRRGEHLSTATVTLFDEDREFLTGPIKIALRCGAAIVQGFVISRPKFYYRLVLAGELDADATPAGGSEADEDARIVRMLQQYARRVEDHARECPDHLMRI